MKARVWFSLIMLLASLWSLAPAQAEVKVFILTVTDGTLELNGTPAHPVESPDRLLLGEVKKGETVRVHLSNIGRSTHILSFPAGFTVTHEDGLPLSTPRKESSLALDSGKRYDLLLTATRPGPISFVHAIRMPGPFMSVGPGEHAHTPAPLGTRAGAGSALSHSPALLLQLDTHYKREKQHPEAKE